MKGNYSKTDRFSVIWKWPLSARNAAADSSRKASELTEPKVQKVWSLLILAEGDLSNYKRATLVSNKLCEFSPYNFMGLCILILAPPELLHMIILQTHTVFLTPPAPPLFNTSD